MKLAIMQPYLLPYIGYFQLLYSSDKFVLHDDVQWIKGGWINRNRILMSNKASMLTLSVKKRSSLDTINKFEISPEHCNRAEFLKKIKAAYLRSPFYKEILPMLSSIIMYDEPNLVKLIKHSLDSIKKYLGIRTPIVCSSELDINTALRGKNRVIKICKTMNADTYINPIGGLGLYDKSYFSRNDIKLHFLKTGDVQYRQFKGEFVPNLSMIDIMMFNEPKEIRRMLKNYKLV